jgi:hypothetical protein
MWSCCPVCSSSLLPDLYESVEDRYPDTDIAVLPQETGACGRGGGASRPDGRWSSADNACRSAEERERALSAQRPVGPRSATSRRWGDGRSLRRQGKSRRCHV